MTLNSYVQSISNLAHAARVLIEAVHYSLEPVEKTGAPLTSRVETVARSAILTLELVKLLPLDLETKKELVTIEALVRFTKAAVKCELAYLPFKDPSISSELMAIMRNRAELDLMVATLYEKFSVEELTAKGWSTFPKAVEEVRFMARCAPFAMVAIGCAETVLRLLAIKSELIRQEEAPLIPGALIEAGPESVFDFLSFNTIPEQLYNDSILSQYQDSITGVPIRFAMTHRRHPEVLYERASIQAHINRELARGVKEPLCPSTRDTITVAELIPSPAAQAIIDNRLRKLSDRLKTEYENNFKAAVAATPI
jgi:hypothetical protein